MYRHTQGQALGHLESASYSSCGFIAEEPCLSDAEGLESEFPNDGSYFCFYAWGSVATEGLLAVMGWVWLHLT